MPVTGKWLDEQPPSSPNLIRNIVAGLIGAVLVFLAFRVIAAATFAPVTPTPAKPEQAAATATTTPPSSPTPAPTATATPAPAAPTAGDACPPADEPPAGARLGWLARATGCPDIALASVNGVRQWVRRSILPDDFYYQLPEVQP